MKTPQSKSFAIPVTLLLFVQLACGIGGQSGNNQPGLTQPSANSLPAATQTSQPTKSDRGTPAEAQAMLTLAVEHYNQVGRDQALADFNAGAAPFTDRDLYVVCIGSGGIVAANGGFPQYVGISADALKDAEGKPVGTTIWTQGNAQGEGSIQFNWINPVSGNTEAKILFFKKVGEDVCGVGAYNP